MLFRWPPRGNSSQRAETYRDIFPHNIILLLKPGNRTPVSQAQRWLNRESAKTKQAYALEMTLNA